MYDLIIIGGGPAGITAGIYAARKKLKTLLLTKDFIGQTGVAGKIENWPGKKEILGPELMSNFEDHLKVHEIEIKEEKVKSLKRENDFIVKTEKDTFSAKAVIVASGRKPRALDVPGEKDFIGKGVVYCTTCDAPLFKNKKVIVVGGGNAGFESAIELTDHTDKVSLFECFSDFTADEFLQEKAKEKGVVLRKNIKVLKMKGENFLKKIKYINAELQEEVEEDVEGVFVQTGSVPITDYIEIPQILTPEGDIMVDPENNMTKVEGLFAAGDVTPIKGKQVVIATGEGAKAALSAYKYIKNIK